MNKILGGWKDRDLNRRLITHQTEKRINKSGCKQLSKYPKTNKWEDASHMLPDGTMINAQKMGIQDSLKFQKECNVIAIGYVPRMNRGGVESTRKPTKAQVNKILRFMNSQRPTMEFIKISPTTGSPEQTFTSNNPISVQTWTSKFR
jgi:hypothetical protein